MSEMNRLLRFNAPAHTEFKITAVHAGDTSGELFTSSLTSGNTRIACYAYNNNGSSSGEVYWGDINVTSATGFPIPVGSVVEIPLVVDLDFYFVSTSGEVSDIRVLELA